MATDETTTILPTNAEIMDHSTLDDVIRAAQAEASSNLGMAIPTMIYKMGGRYFITTTFPIRLLTERVRLDTLKKGQDPDEHINRPLIPEHVRAITSYLETQEGYILPAITLSIRRRLRCHVIAGTYAVRFGYTVLPIGVTFDVTDGQHRIKALEEILRRKPEIGDDGITVTIIPEMDIDKIHQDFVDCAQVKAIPPSLLTVFNQRDPLARITRAITENVAVFRGRIEKTGKTVGKNSVNVFTMNQVRAGVAELITGDSLLAGPQLKKAVLERAPDGEKADYYAKLLSGFYTNFTAHHKPWDTVAMSNNANHEQVDTANLRQEFISFTATGLVVIGRVGHHILMHPDIEVQQALTTQLAQLDWRRNSRMWANNIVDASGKIATNRSPVETAVAIVKRELGMELSHRDQQRLVNIGQKPNEIVLALEMDSDPRT